MLVRCVVVALEASTFIHSISHPLCVPEMLSHDANVTVATEVAGHASKTNFSLSTQQNEPKYSHRC